jgi:hypothetical protein
VAIAPGDPDGIDGTDVRAKRRSIEVEQVAGVSDGRHDREVDAGLQQARDFIDEVPLAGPERERGREVQDAHPVPDQ